MLLNALSALVSQYGPFPVFSVNLLLYPHHIELLQIIVQFCFKLHVFHTYFTDSVPETDLLNIAIVSATHFCNAALHFTSTTF